MDTEGPMHELNADLARAVRERITLEVGPIADGCGSLAGLVADVLRLVANHEEQVWVGPAHPGVRRLRALAEEIER